MKAMTIKVCFFAQRLVSYSVILSAFLWVSIIKIEDRTLNLRVHVAVPEKGEQSGACDVEMESCSGWSEVGTYTAIGVAILVVCLGLIVITSTIIAVLCWWR